MLNQFTQHTKPCLETGISLLDMLLPRPENPIVEGLVKDLRGAFLLFALVVAIVSVAIFVDFVLGIIKSLSSGRRIRSFRIRESFAKMTAYYGSILLLFLVDLIFISHDLYDRPYMAMFAGGGVVITEVLSWFESLEDKERSKLNRSIRAIAGAIKGLGGNIDVGKFVSDAIEGDKPQSTGGQIKSGRASTPENSNAIDSIDHPENHAPGYNGIRPKPNIHEKEEHPLV